MTSLDIETPRIRWDLDELRKSTLVDSWSNRYGKSFHLVCISGVTRQTRVHAAVDLICRCTLDEVQYNISLGILIYNFVYIPFVYASNILAMLFFVFIIGGN